MPDRDIPAVPPDVAVATTAAIPGTPAELLGNPRRQAVASIHGTVYQAWCSIDAWLRLTSPDEVIYLEGAEDFDITRTGDAIAVQVKHHAGPISLAYKKARGALESFWDLVSKDPSRHVQFHYLTTSSIAMEQDASFDGLTGLEAWRVARTDLDMAARLAKYLVQKLDAPSPLHAFLVASTPEEIQRRLIQRVHWLTEQPNIDVVKRSVNDRISVLLHSRRRAVSLASKVQMHLESRFWELVLEKESAKRCLTLGDLLRQVEDATTTYLPVPIEQLPDLIGNVHSGSGLLDLLLQKSPKPPDPLLRRIKLTQQLEDLVRQRRVVLLTGTVYKGKTTLAQLVASTLCPDAWWVQLTARRPDQADSLLLALAARIELGNCPSLIVIDDLDIGPDAHRVYRDSLALVLHRTHTSGRGVLLTAQGTSSEVAAMEDFRSMDVLDVPEMSVDEVETVCVEHGCPPERASTWAALVQLWAKGHPKLIQVRVAELVARGWPAPSATDLTAQPLAVTSAKQIARRLLNGSVSAPVAEFVYTASESVVPMDRSVAIRLGESIDGLTNAGDVLDSLVGKWLERLDGNRFRTTSLLQGVVSEVWSQEKRKLAHIRLHDAILAKRTLSPAEAAALLFHAFVAVEGRRLAMTALRLQSIEGSEARREVERGLLWLPYVALEAGQTITDDPIAAVILRSLQFRVASTLDADSLPQVSMRWAEEIERITNNAAKTSTLALMWFSIGSAESLKIPLKLRLEAIAGIAKLPSELPELHAEDAKRFFEQISADGDLPVSGTITQMMLLNASRCVRDADSLSELVQWLDNAVTDNIRQEFDSMLEWPVLQDLGAFVHSAWATAHDETKDWEPWLPLLDRLDDYAKRRASPQLGRETAKAKAIIMTEYLGRSQEALEVLDQAEASFGSSVILMEQRANVRFQLRDDTKVLEIWEELTRDPTSKAALDPFAYRRAAMSAARLRMWSDAEQIFRAGADSIESGTLETTKLGLSVDAALSASLGGNQASAARLLGEAVMSLPVEASGEGNEQWEALQRAAVEVCRVIENAMWKPAEAKPKFEPGDASSPALKVPKAEAGQAARTELMRAQILTLAATLGRNLPRLDQEIRSLATSRYLYVRWLAAEAQLALAYGSGAGAGFIEAVLALDATTGSLSRRRGQSLLIPDDRAEQEEPSAPERWFGLLAAGICCAGQDLIPNLVIWLDTSRRALGPDAALSGVIQLLLEGATRPSGELFNMVVNASNPAALRCGAAAKLLLEMHSPDRALALQGLLVSAAVSGESLAFQGLFNRHIAQRFASVWHHYAQNPFLLYSPRTSVPALLSALNDIEYGSGTLRTLLSAAAQAAQAPLSEFMVRVW